MAGWMIILGSLLVVVSVVEVLTGLRSLQTREAIEAFLAEPPGDSLGLGVEPVLQIMRVAAMVTAGCATAAAVLGWHVLRRNRGARVGLAVLALPLFVTGMLSGGFMSALVAASALLLWLQPARDWFDGKAPVAPPAPASPATTPPRPTAADPTTGSTTHPPQWPAPPAAPPADPTAPPGDPAAGPGPTQLSEPRAVQGFGERPSWLPTNDPASPAPPVPWGASRRPDAVLIATLITVLTAGFALLSAVASMVLVATQPDLLMRELERQEPDLAAQGVTEQMLLTTTMAMGVVMVLWSLASIVLAIVMLRRKAWAAGLLSLSSVVVAGFCFLGAFATVALAVPALAGVAVFGLLRRPDVRAWFAAGRR